VWSGGAKMYIACLPPTPLPRYARNDTPHTMPTLMQKIRLALRGWNRRREERDKEFLAKNVWSPGLGRKTPAEAGAPSGFPSQIDMDGLTVACLDSSGVLAYYLDIETGDVIDTREAMTGDRA